MNLGWITLTLAVYIPAAARITKLINSDTILDPVRLFIARRIRDPKRSEAERLRWGKLDYWMSCPWCAGLWVTFGTAWAPLWFSHNPIIQYLGLGLATSMLIGLAARWTADDAPEVAEQ